MRARTYWAVMALAAAMIVPFFVDLGQRGVLYQGMTIPPPYVAKAMIKDKLNLFAKTAQYADANDPQWHMWQRMLSKIFVVPIVHVLLSVGLDKVLQRLGCSAMAAQRARAAMSVFQSFTLLWGLYGYHALSPAVILLINFVFVHSARSVTEPLPPRAQKWARLAALGAVWAFSFHLVYDADSANWLVDPVRTQLVRLRGYVQILPYFLHPGNMVWTSSVRFILFRNIDYASHVLLDGLAGASPIQHDPRHAIGELTRFMIFGLYAPLVWQGPLVSYKDFSAQLIRRYSDTGSKGLRVAPRKWKLGFAAMRNAVVAWVLLVFLTHNFLVGVLFKRIVFARMRSGEIVALLLTRFFNSYLRMIMSWDYFRGWAIMDGVEAPNNFPSSLLNVGSVREFWATFNASVRLWIMANIYRPLCTILELSEYLGVVATFVFMVYWHMGTFSWVVFSACNAVFIIGEMLFERYVHVPRRFWRLELVGECAVYIFKFTTLFLLQVNMSLAKDSSWHLSHIYTMLYRAFVDETVTEKVAADYHVDNDAMLQDRVLGLLHPQRVLLCMLLLLCTMKLGQIKFSERAPPKRDAPCDGVDLSLSHAERRERAAKLADETRARCATLLDVLDARAGSPEDARRTAFLWLDEVGEEADSLTYLGLQRRARALAQQLQSAYKVQEGDRIVLVYPPGLDFLVAFFAVMYAGAVAVPVYPPDPRDASRDRVFRGVLRDCEPRLILSNSTYMGVIALSRAAKGLKRALEAVVPLVALAAPVVAGVVLTQLKFSMKYYPRLFWGTWLPDAEFRDEEERGAGLVLTDGELAGLAGIAAASIAAVALWHRWVGGRAKRAAKGADATVAVQPVAWLNTSSLIRSAMPFRLARLVSCGLDRLWPARPLAATRRARASDVAYLQYTSGSTSDPKGVRITHANLMHQGWVNQVGLACHSTQLTSVNWCPQYHDLGLVVCMMGTVFAGTRLVGLSPLHFLRNPLLWVRAVHRYRAQFSAAPNFAYAFVARKVRMARAQGAADPELAELDLSSWFVAGNGGEPVRASALDAFSRAFRGNGFERCSFYPCFGLAEHTIMASGRKGRRDPTLRQLDLEALGNNQVVFAALGTPRGAAGTTELVGCGEPLEDVQVCIVDPETHEALELDASGSTWRVGEVWLRSPSVAKGYWGFSEEANRAVFDACTAHGDRGFLRTGDLGFMNAGELYLCGRLKDLIIVDGRNVFPQDVESAAERAAPEVFRPSSSAAFAVGSDAGERQVVLVLELRRELDKGSSGSSHAALKAALRAAFHAVTEEQRVALSRICLVHSGVLPKTSSGKIRRRAIAQLLAEDQLEPVLELHGAELASEVLPEESLASLHDPDMRVVVLAILRANLAGRQWPAVPEEFCLTSEILQMPTSSQLAPEDEPDAMFSSLEAVQFVAQFEARLAEQGLPLVVRPDAVFRFATVGQLAAGVLAANL